MQPATNNMALPGGGGGRLQKVSCRGGEAKSVTGVSGLSALVGSVGKQAFPLPQHSGANSLYGVEVWCAEVCSLIVLHGHIRKLESLLPSLLGTACRR